MAILVTGGAGYIGSVTVEILRPRANKSSCWMIWARPPRCPYRDPPFYQGRTGDRALVARIAKENEIESCIHFAAMAYVGESVEKPAAYFENNVEQGVALMGALLEAGVRRVVFSSTCATYGEPKEIPIHDNAAMAEESVRLDETFHGAPARFLRRGPWPEVCLATLFQRGGATRERGEHHGTGVALDSVCDGCLPCNTQSRSCGP